MLPTTGLQHWLETRTRCVWSASAAARCVECRSTAVLRRASSSRGGNVPCTAATRRTWEPEQASRAT